MNNAITLILKIKIDVILESYNIPGLNQEKMKIHEQGN